MKQPVFELANVTVVRGGAPVLRDFSWTANEGEAWAVVGPTGSGKTTLAETLLGRLLPTQGALAWPLFARLRAAGKKVDYVSQVVAHVTFREDSRLFSYAGRYYQQRFEFADTEEPLSVETFLRTGTTASEAHFGAVCTRFGIGELLAQPFMTLSNGQTRRARLARAMLANPEVLILDDPFIGLDTQARADLSGLLRELAGSGKRLVLICRADAAPAWVTHTLRLGEPLPPAKNLSPQPPPLRREGEPNQHNPETCAARQCLAPPPLGGVGGLPTTLKGEGVGGRGSPLIELNDVTVTHAGHTILDRVSWAVRAGERWALLGPNGSGKTTLLSLLCGDHPQAYSNDVRLFGRRRGSGETIWDVKRNVGLLSPEFHLYFTEPLSAARAAATGFFDGVADRPTTPEQEARVNELFAALGIAHLALRAFKTLSTGEQRLVLLARALVKRPALVILDEPFQGLDETATARALAWLNTELSAEQTLLFVTHEPAELPPSVTKILRLAKGRVV